MGSAWNQLEQMLTCPICLDKFKNPRLLPCQHSFCGDSCMDGLVDYARRQIKCPECRAEHRIPYQGVQNLPINVTLIRFLELHSRITGEDTEPVPTFMEKCSICSEKIEGVTRCAHCEKKVCPECKEAHIDILRREVGRVNGQTKRCLSKFKDFREQIDKAQEKLKINHAQVRKEIQDSCRRLIEELESKQKRLVDDVDLYVEQEHKTLDKLRTAAHDELIILDSNSKLAEERFQSSKYQWTDIELWELKEIYARAMEFVRLFDADLGDFGRKIRFMLIPEFDSIRRRLCELGELKFADTATSSMAQALQYCNATGQVALEICQAASAQAAAQMANMQNATGYTLAHSNSNSNMLSGAAGLQPSPSGLLELPGMQNALMRSQSDHRLASQFQQRLKQQQREQQESKLGTSRYGRSTAATSDYDTEATLRSRYAPPRSSIGSKDAYDLTRDWPRPSDSDTDFGAGVQFKSAFMRRKGQQYGTGPSSVSSAATSTNMMDDDDDIMSEASYGGGIGPGNRNVRFNTNDPGNDIQALIVKLFDVKELEHAPLSGVPKLEDSSHLATRLHQMGARAIAEKKQAEEERARDKDLIESAKQAMSQANQRLAAKKQMSEDDIEKQKKANKENQRAISPEPIMSEREPEDLDEPEPPAVVGETTAGETQARSESTTDTTTASRNDSRRNETINELITATHIDNSASSTTSGSDQHQQQQQAAVNSRRNLYSQAITEKSRRQLANAIQEASALPRGRMSSRSSQDAGGANGSVDATSTQQAVESPGSASSSTSGRTRRTLRSSGRSMSKQSSIDAGSDTGTIQRRPKRLIRAETTSFSQQSQDAGSTPEASQISNQSKNFRVGSVGKSGDNSSWSLDRSDDLTSSTTKSHTPSSSTRRLIGQEHQLSHQTTNTTDDDEPTTAIIATSGGSGSGSNFTNRRRPIVSSQTSSTGSGRFRYSTDNDETGSHQSYKPGMTTSGGLSRRKSTVDSDDDSDDDDNQSTGLRYTSRTGHRKSREFLPNAVNKLLDRSAQIRRDSQEARGRGDSPQRGNDPTPSTTSRPTNRYAYQRSTNADLDDGPATNSSNSVYTTASSGPLGGSRKSSNEDDSTTTSYSRYSSRTGAGNASTRATDDSTSGPLSRRSNYSSSSNRQDSTGDSQAPATTFQSRFLSKSRTSSALADSGSSFDSPSNSPINSRSTGVGSSSRDRFLQSTNAALSSNSSSSTTTGSMPNSSQQSTTSSSLYSRGALTSPTTGFNQFDTIAACDQNDIADGSEESKPIVDNDAADTDDSRISSSINHENDKDDDARKHESEGSDERSLTDEDITKTGSSASISHQASNSDVTKSQRQITNETNINKVHVNDDKHNGDGARIEALYEDRCEMIMKIGTRGTQSGEFTWPRGVVASGSEILVADSSNHRVQVFDSNGRWKREFGSYGNEEGQFDCLAGVAICEKPETRYVVSDRYNHRVQLFSPDGDFILSFGGHGNEPGDFNLPWGVCCSQHSDLIYVCDKENHRVQIFTYEGDYISQLGNGKCGTRPGELQFPHYIAATKNSKLAVTDTNNHRVQVFDSSTGQVVENFGSEGSSIGQFKFPRGIAIDQTGCFIIGDSGNNRIQIFDPRCNPIKSIGCWGTGPGQFKGIEGVAVEPDGGRILVCDRENHRIQLF